MSRPLAAAMEHHLSNQEFFEKLGQEFSYRKTRDHGAIYLVQKRLIYEQENLPPLADGGAGGSADGNTALFPIIIRATNGKSKANRDRKLKLSTIVNPADLAAFFSQYAEICKTGMSALKPRDKKKKKKSKKKKGSSAPVGTAAKPS